MSDKNELQIILEAFSAQSGTFIAAVNGMTKVMIQNGKESQELKQNMIAKLDDLKDEMKNVGNQFQNFTVDFTKGNEILKSDLKSIVCNEVGKIKSTGKWITMFIMTIGIIGGLFSCLTNVLLSNELLNKIYLLVSQISLKTLP